MRFIVGILFTLLFVSCGPEEKDCAYILNKINGLEQTGEVNQCTQGPAPNISNYDARVTLLTINDEICNIELSSLDPDNQYTINLEFDYECTVAEESIYRIILLKDNIEKGSITDNILTFIFDLPLCGETNEFISIL